MLLTFRPAMPIGLENGDGRVCETWSFSSSTLPSLGSANNVSELTDSITLVLDELDAN